MFRTIAGLIVFLVFIAGPLPSHAQLPAPPTATCAYSFTSGIHKTELDYCVTVNGNVSELITQGVHEQIIGFEGYAMCNESPVASYWDYAAGGDSGNWNPATLLKQTATSVKIARTTADGNWTLTQTFTQDPRTPAIKIVMALKNNTGTPRVVYLVRYANLDIDGTSNNFGATAKSAFGWNASIPFGANNGFGTQLQNVGIPQFGYLQGFARTIPQGPNPCNFAGDSSGFPQTNIDGSIVLAYVDTIGAIKTKTATMVYRGK
jgi:hypothetical protein